MNINLQWIREPLSNDIDKLEELGKKIHSGSGGSVYEILPDCKYVIKIDVCNMEWKMAKKIFDFQNTNDCHPNIVPILGIGIIDNMKCYIMPKLKNTPWKIIKKSTTIIKKMLITILSSLNWLEKNTGMSHIDIKYDNIMYLDNETMLIDFSLVYPCDKIFHPVSNYYIWPNEPLCSSILSIYTLGLFIANLFNTLNTFNIKEIGSHFVNDIELKRIVDLMLEKKYPVETIYEYSMKRLTFIS